MNFNSNKKNRIYIDVEKLYPLESSQTRSKVRWYHPRYLFPSLILCTSISPTTIFLASLLSNFPSGASM